MTDDDRRGSSSGGKRKRLGRHCTIRLDQRPAAGDNAAEVVDLAHATLIWSHLQDLNFDDEDQEGDGWPDDSFTL